MERRERAHRVARERDHGGAAWPDDAAALRHSRPHRDLDELHSPVGREHFLDRVVDAHRHPTGGEDEVGVAGQLGQQGAHLWPVVPEAGRPGDLGPRRLDEGAQHDVVGVDDLTVPQRRAGLDELVAGGDDRHPRAGVHLHLGDVGRGHEGELPGPEADAGPQDHCSLAHVLTPVSQVPADLRCQGDRDGRGTAVGRLDGHDRVSAVGQGRPGHDPQRTARREHVLNGVSRGDVTVDRQGEGRAGRSAREVGRPHGVPVHGRVVEAGEVDGGGDVGREHEPERVAHGHGGRRQRSHQCQDRVAVLGERSHQSSPSRTVPAGTLETSAVTRTSPTQETSPPKVVSPSTRRLEQRLIEGTPCGKRASKSSTNR